jgi:hypothetical protein
MKQKKIIGYLVIYMSSFKRRSYTYTEKYGNKSKQGLIIWRTIDSYPIQRRCFKYVDNAI